MTLEKILENVTRIEDNPELSKKNYLRSLQYISNLYNFRFLAADFLNFNEIEFLPSFIDCYICEELGIASFTEENELRLLKIKFGCSLEDEEKVHINNELAKLCTFVEWDNSIVTCYLRNFRQKRNKNENKIIVE